MDTATRSRQSPASSISGWNILLGCWVIISPFVLAYSNLLAPMWNDVATGAAIGLLALMRATAGDRSGSSSWLNVVLGIWLIISPWVLGFAGLVAPLWNNIGSGVVVAVIAWASASAPARPAEPAPPAT